MKIPNLTPAQKKLLTRADDRGILQRPGSNGLQVSAWRRTMERLRTLALVAPSPHDGDYELTAEGSRVRAIVARESTLGPPLTPTQYALLQRLAVPVGRYVRRSDIVVARALDALGLVTLTDNGTVGDTNWDGEQWLAEITPAGRARIGMEVS